MRCVMIASSLNRPRLAVGGSATDRLARCLLLAEARLRPAPIGIGGMARRIAVASALALVCGLALASVSSAQVVFMRSGSVWVMNDDGSGPRQLASPAQVPGVNDPVGLFKLSTPRRVPEQRPDGRLRGGAHRPRRHLRLQLRRRV